MASTKRELRKLEERSYASPWQGSYRKYDIIKEATIAFVAVLVLVFVLAIVFSSPDKPPVTIRQWADHTPRDFLATSLLELEGASDSATYGPPYNTKSGETQYLGPVSIEKFFGVHYPLHPKRDFVLRPLISIPADPATDRALAEFDAASKTQQHRWEVAYGKGLAHATVSITGAVNVSAPGAGPVTTLMSSLLAMARSGALDSSLVSHSGFYTTDYTKPIMFIGDSWKAFHTKGYWGKLVAAEHLKGSQWGMMNETGSWPGQPWLWLYTLWYQVPPMSTSSNGDAEVMAIMTVLSLLLIAVPFIPGLRDIPRKLKIYKLIWRYHYKEA
jgi:hypothetical protein